MTIGVYTSVATGGIVSTTEWSLTNNSTSLQSLSVAGMYQLFIDLPSVAAGDEFEAAVREKNFSGGTQRRWVIGRFNGAQAEHFMSVPMLLLTGWDFTLLKATGTDRYFGWSIRSVT